MKENKYDEEHFFSQYSEMDRSKFGLDAAGEWPTLEPMLPMFRDKRVLDLGCGFGWHCNYAADHGAKQVTGVDISANMLKVAREKTVSKKITYIRSSMEDLDFPPGSFDIVLSSLAFHYVEDFDGLASNIRDWLVPGGNFIFSVEHPVFTAQGKQDWIYNGDGSISHWPVDNYFLPGKREAVFLGEPVIKYHRPLNGYVGPLVRKNFALLDIAEPRPTEEMLETSGFMKNELRRPMMLIISALKK